MNSKAINKLSLYIEMLKGRYGSGEYFKEIDISFKSGVKIFPAKVKKRGIPSKFPLRDQNASSPGNSFPIMPESMTQ